MTAWAGGRLLSLPGAPPESGVHGVGSRLRRGKGCRVPSAAAVPGSLAGGRACAGSPWSCSWAGSPHSPAWAVGLPAAPPAAFRVLLGCGGRATDLEVLGEK